MAGAKKTFLLVFNTYSLVAKNDGLKIALGSPAIRQISILRVKIQTMEADRGHIWVKVFCSLQRITERIDGAHNAR